MTTVREVRQIYRPIMQRHADLKETTSRFLCKVPVHHLACRVFVERTRLGDHCQPMWMVTALFRPVARVGPSLGTYNEHLFRPNSPRERPWPWSDPTMVADATEVIEAVALPKLEFYGTLEGYATLPVRDHWIHYEPREDRMLVHIAMGDLDAAQKIWREREPLYRGKTYHPDSLLHRWQGQLAAVAEPLHACDRSALARILHDWEAANVRGTEIERYWEPMPFPLEL